MNDILASTFHWWPFDLFRFQLVMVVVVVLEVVVVVVVGEGGTVYSRSWI